MREVGRLLPRVTFFILLIDCYRIPFCHSDVFSARRMKDLKIFLLNKGFEEKGPFVKEDKIPEIDCQRATLPYVPSFPPVYLV